MGTLEERNESNHSIEEWLRRMFLEEQYTVKELAEMKGCSIVRIYQLLRQYRIALRQQAPLITQELLENLYVKDGLSVTEIVQRLEITRSAVFNYLQRYNIPVKRPTQRRKVTPTKEWLLHRHYEENVSWAQIMKETGYSPSSFHTLLYRLGIERKQYVQVQSRVSRDDLYQWHVAEGLTGEKIAAMLGCHATAIQRLIKRYKLDPGRALVNEPTVPPVSRDILFDLYWTQEKTFQEIADMHHSSIPTVRTWFRKYELPARTGRRKTGITANSERHQRTKDRRYPHEFDTFRRFRIHSRDNWRCQMPGCGCAERWRLEVHHIISIEDGGTNDAKNGISLCRACHVSIFGKESQYAVLFQEIVNTLPSAQRSYIGETPAVDNPDGSLVAEDPHE